MRILSPIFAKKINSHPIRQFTIDFDIFYHFNCSSLWLLADHNSHPFLVSLLRFGLKNATLIINQGSWDVDGRSANREDLFKILIRKFLMKISNQNSEYEAINFSRTEARFSRAMAKFFSCLSCKIWIVTVPDVTNRIADKGNEFIFNIFEVSVDSGWYILNEPVRRCPIKRLNSQKFQNLHFDLKTFLRRNHKTDN